MKNPLISVIVPAYNAERYIEKCLLSLKNQDFKNFEIVVVDDGSTDETPRIASSYAKVIKSPHNVGEGGARNLGAKSARGEILAFTDADVVLPNDWLTRIMKNMKTYNVQCVGGGYRGSIGNSFMELFAHLELCYRRTNMPQFVNTIVSNNFACYRDLFFRAGGFPEKYKCEDMRLSFKISKEHKILWDRENGVYHHFRPSLKAYLKQQFYFGRDTVWTYHSYPEMFLIKTHQTRWIYLETALMFLAMVGFFIFPASFLLFVSMILILNFHFLKYLKKEKLSVILCCLLILLRDAVCVASIFAGIGMCLKGMLRFSSKGNTSRGKR